MKWIATNRDLYREDFKKTLPLDSPFLCLWKGTVCICEYEEEEDHFYIGMMPACNLGFWKLDRERERKITHYMRLELPDDY